MSAPRNPGCAQAPLHADNRQTADPHRAGEPKRASAHQALDWRGAISRDPHARLWRFPAARTYTLTRARTVPNALLGEALFGGLDHTLTHPPLATSPERSRPHAWAKPALAGRPTTRAPIYTFREPSRTLVWAKPCLAGRPTALVRTQSPEQNTSRGRPPGMELPDYPVVVLTPTPKDQDGPALRPPAGSFPGFVPRYASRRVFPVFVARYASRRSWSGSFSYSYSSPQTFRAVSTTSSSFRFCSSHVSRFPNMVEANPHWGAMARFSSGTYRAASSIRWRS
jgi:hypothetical protein